MCGRYSLTAADAELTSSFRVTCPGGLTPRYNIAPGQGILAIRQRENSMAREAVLLHWGLVPSWAETPQIANSLTQARSETVREKPAFKESFRTRRCLLVATGFYEWHSSPPGKQPFHIAHRAGQPFAMGGLWDRWEGNGAVIESCTVLTCAAHQGVAPIHHRMPVVIPASQYARWLSPSEIPAAETAALLQPLPPEDTVCYPVSTFVNSVRNNGPQCILACQQQQRPANSQRTLPFDE
jgi:putative SOS response-associated peptidase YedK